MGHGLSQLLERMGEVQEQGYVELQRREWAEGEDFPTWFHFGFRLASAADVRDLHGRMSAGEAPVRPLHDDADYVWFRCADPDGHAIEVYWE